MKKSQNHFLTFILLFVVGLGGGKVGECVAARITEQLFTLTGWTHVPSALRLHRTPCSPSVELTNSDFGVAQRRIPPSCTHLGQGRRKNLSVQELSACEYKISSEICRILHCIVSSRISWLPENSPDNRMR